MDRLPATLARPCRVPRRRRIEPDGQRPALTQRRVAGRPVQGAVAGRCGPGHAARPCRWNPDVNPSCNKVSYENTAALHGVAGTCAVIVRDPSPNAPLKDASELRSFQSVDKNGVERGAGAPQDGKRLELIRIPERSGIVATRELENEGGIRRWPGSLHARRTAAADPEFPFVPCHHSRNPGEVICHPVAAVNLHLANGERRQSSSSVTDARVPAA